MQTSLIDLYYYDLIRGISILVIYKWTLKRIKYTLVVEFIDSLMEASDLSTKEYCSLLVKGSVYNMIYLMNNHSLKLNQ